MATRWSDAIIGLRFESSMFAPSHLVGAIDAQRHQSNLSSALRLFVLKFYRNQLPDRLPREGDPG
jgi:predicted DNA-binding ribbon-helix-helix protein